MWTKMVVVVNFGIAGTVRAAESSKRISCRAHAESASGGDERR